MKALVVEADRAHVREVAGSNRAPATKIKPRGASSLPFDFSQKCSQPIFTEDLLNRFLSGRANGLSPRTIMDYKWRLGLLVGYPLTPEGIKSFLDSLTCGTGKWNYFKSLCATVNWLYRSGYLTTHPAELTESPRRQSKILPAISEEQLDTLLARCHSGREKAIPSLLSYSGMRLSEVASVKAQEASTGKRALSLSWIRATDTGKPWPGMESFGNGLVSTIASNLMPVAFR
jgi:hypothetical protein